MVRKQHPFGLSFTVFVAMAGIMIHMQRKMGSILSCKMKTTLCGYPS